MLCPICNKEFEPKRRNQPTCGDDECRLEWRRAYSRAYMDGRRAWHREYNRIWMAKCRARQKGQEEKPKDTLVGLDYAERQKQKTLAMVGKIEL